MINRKNQAGITFIGLLIVLTLIGFFALLGMKLTPFYLETFKIDNGLKSLINEPSVTEWSKRDIRKKFIARMDIEDVERFTEANIKDFMEIDKSGGEVTITLEYEAVTPLFGNVSLLAQFNKVVSSE